MAEEVEASSSRLTPRDLHAIVTYLRSVPAVRRPGLLEVPTVPASESPKEAQRPIEANGKAIYAGACASCHGWSGVSLLSSYATLTGDRTVNDPSAVNVAQ